MTPFVITICVLGLSSVAWAVFKICTIYNYWKNRKVHTLKPQFPFGNSKNAFLQRMPLGFDVYELYTEIKSRSERYGGYYNFTIPVFIPADLQLIKAILITNSDCFINRVSHFDVENDPLTANLLHSRGAHWKRMRSKTSPFFGNVQLKPFFPFVIRKTDELVKSIAETPNALDVREVLDRYAIDLMGLYISGIDFKIMKNKDSDLQRQLEKFLNTSIVDTLIRFFITIPKLLKYFKIMTFKKGMTEFFMMFIDDMVQTRQLSRSDRKVVLDALTQRTSDKFARAEIAGNVTMLFLAGYETTSTTLTFCLYELAYNMELQEKLRAEINMLDNLSFNSVVSLTLLDKCIKETLRKYPSATIITRECTKTFHVPDSNIVLEEGSEVYIPIRGIHWDPEYYPNPQNFDPERFSEENFRGRHPCSWLPFGAGPRHCIASWR
ncbi:probable cytochrome P450 6a13 isoform X2 [Photinus pyralis]|uniref:probable cytochrome P450 6a13 isoform X2 n=1 Tax=Photinus pyralis TaxID=7054 RepID=UPI0012676DED|nr:probable cytochrome P450 6a13 isoform X2 [Photinus pyralis]